jgi:raffinose/stachyose/melibiose transport system substrate-binding protein
MERRDEVFALTKVVFRFVRRPQRARDGIALVALIGLARRIISTPLAGKDLAMTKPSTRSRPHLLVFGYRRSGLLITTAAVIVALLLGACSGSSTASKSTKVSPQHPVTLYIVDGDAGANPLLGAYAALNKRFEAIHPGVKIKFQVEQLSALLATLKLRLSGSSGVPDATQVSQGYANGGMGQLVADGLLKNLSSIAAADDWSARQSASLLALDGRFSNDGKTMGSGPLWGISATSAYIGMLENTAIAKKLGISSPPTTLGQLEQDMAIAKAHGVVAMAMGTNDGYMPAWILYELVMAYTSPQILSTITSGVSNTLPTAAMTTAAGTLQKWQNHGYFTPGDAGYSSTDAFNKFVAGQALFVVTGSWSVPVPGPRSSTAKFRMLLFPMQRANTLAAVAAGDEAWAIPSHSPHPRLAAEYINYITSPAANSAWIAAGQVPASLSANELHAAAGAHLSPASYDALAHWVGLLNHGYFQPYMDWSTPTFLTTIIQSDQSLLAGKITPSGFTTALQADYGPFVKQLHG